VNLPGVPVREIAAIPAKSDAGAEAEMACLAERWPGFETITLYDGERTVSVLSDRRLGIPTQALELADRAA
jgi:hypothetical protein